MTRTLLTPAAGALPALLALLAACASPGGTGPGKSPDPAVSAVTAEICGLVTDGEVTPAEVKTLGRVLDRAHSLGLPDDVLDPAHEIATSGQAEPETLRKLRAACT
jgi:hypothetical protein